MTEEQKKASEDLWQTNAQALQLIAGAGSGKTYTLIETVTNCINNFCLAEETCLITFTKKAANELKERLKERGICVGFAGTMHSLAYDLLKKSGNSPRVINNSQNIYNSIFRNIFPQYAHIPSDLTGVDKILDDNEKNILNDSYKRHKIEVDKLDFDDLIEKAKSLLLKSEILHKFKAVFVDEFQDTSYEQFTFIQALKPEKLFIVGDDWQSIYKFRGGDVSLSLNFSNFVQNTKRYFLTKNFRSQKKIVKLGNNIIKFSKEYIKKKLIAHNGAYKTPGLYIYNKPIDYEEVLHNFYKKLKREEPLTFLVRTNYLKRKLESSLRADDKIITIHSSKGLEFENVIIFGVNQNIMPHRWGDIDEETRLLYVAITRAKRNLEIIASETNQKYSVFLPLLAKKCKVSYI
ncbi:MAG: UvrD-helicase domain-containing protein [Spirochaetia bacterium]|nr:UvrD-helicase domain-containing protein [Spirochaetia bacterium]